MHGTIVLLLCSTWAATAPQGACHAAQTTLPQLLGRQPNQPLAQQGTCSTSVRRTQPQPGCGGPAHHPHADPHTPARVRPLISRLAPIGRLSAEGMGSGTVLAMTWLTTWLACMQDGGRQQQQHQR